MNAAIQCLNHIRALQRYFRKLINPGQYATGGSDALLVIEIQKLFTQMWSGEYATIAPRGFLNALHSSCPFFKGYGQHDSQEFLRIVLDKLHELLKVKTSDMNDHSIISDCFKGSIIASVTCLRCGNINQKVDSIYELGLSIPSSSEKAKYASDSRELMNPPVSTEEPSSPSILSSFKSFLFPSEDINLYDCLLNFSNPEDLSGSDQVFCEKCKVKCDGKMNYKIKDPPNILIFLLKRFKYSFVGSKITTPVRFPLELNLDKFLVGYMKEKPKGCSYSLNGMIQHSGSIGGGHYIAYCKNYKNNSWYCYNDSTVKPVSEQNVLRTEAYVLVYSRNKLGLRSHASQNPPDAYIPTEWLNKYYHLANPGPVLQRHYLCPHSRIKNTVSLSSFTQISKPQLVSIIDQVTSNQYNTDFDIIEDASHCEICSNFMNRLTIRSDTESKIIEELNSKAKFKGPWYLIPSSWIEKWKNFIYQKVPENPRVEYPGIVNTHEFFSEDGGLKHGLESRKDYRAVNGMVWKAFSVLYGAGPEITRLRVDLYSPDAIVRREPELSKEIMNQLLGIKDIKP
jgi:hypothetical protein